MWTCVRLPYIQSPKRVYKFKWHPTQSPGKIKRREVSWTFTKKLDSFAGPGEIKRREVVLDPQESPEEIESREVELGSESWTSFASVVTQQQWLCSAQQLKQKLCGTLVATQWRGDTALTFVDCSGDSPRPPRSSGSESAVEPSFFLLRPPRPLPCPRP